MAQYACRSSCARRAEALDYCVVGEPTSKQAGRRYDKTEDVVLCLATDREGVQGHMLIRIWLKIPSILQRRQLLSSQPPLG